MTTAKFKSNERYTKAHGLWQYDYGQVLQIQGIDLPSAVEIHFSLRETGGESVPRIGVTTDSITEVAIPDSMLENGDTARDYTIHAFVYLTDESSGQTEYKIAMPVRARPKPSGQAPDDEVDKSTMSEIVQAVNAAIGSKADSMALINGQLVLKSGDNILSVVELPSGGSPITEAVFLVGDTLEANTAFQRAIAQMEEKQLTDTTGVMGDSFTRSQFFFDGQGRLEEDGETIIPRLLSTAEGDMQYSYLASIAQTGRKVILQMPDNFVFSENSTVIFFAQLDNPEDNISIAENTSNVYYKYKEYPDTYHMAVSPMDDYQICLRGMKKSINQVYFNNTLVLTGTKFTGAIHYEENFLDGTWIRESFCPTGKTSGGYEDICMSVIAGENDALPHSIHIYAVHVYNRELTEDEVNEIVAQYRGQYGY